MVRGDLTNKEIEQMGREDPGSAGRYFAEAHEQIEAEQAKKREADDKERFMAAATQRRRLRQATDDSV
jgi:hypothetical protein